MFTVVAKEASILQNDRETSPEETSIVLINREKSPIVQPSSPPRSPTPEEFLPKVACRMFVKKNGKHVGTAKQLQLDLNQSYEVAIKQKLYQQIFKKADAFYDPFLEPNLSIKYAWISKKRLASNTTKKQAIQPHDCTDLDEESDYDALLQEVRQSSTSKRQGERIEDMVLWMQASLVIDGESSARIISDSEEVTAGKKHLV